MVKCLEGKLQKRIPTGKKGLKPKKGTAKKGERTKEPAVLAEKEKGEEKIYCKTGKKIRVGSKQCLGILRDPKQKKYCQNCPFKKQYEAQMVRVVVEQAAQKKPEISKTHLSFKAKVESLKIDNLPESTSSDFSKDFSRVDS